MSVLTDLKFSQPAAQKQRSSGFNPNPLAGWDGVAEGTRTHILADLGPQDAPSDKPKRREPIMGGGRFGQFRVVGWK